MHRILTLLSFAGLITGVAFAISGSTFAAHATCNPNPAAQFYPAIFEAQLKSEGLTVRKIKIRNGYYRVYAMDKVGNKLNVAYSAQTLKKLANAEADLN